MYSVVLMAAMATHGPDAISFGKRRASCFGCYGCAGCYGGCAGCFGGGGYGNGSMGGGWGCAGYGAYGCYGVVSYGQYGCIGIHHQSCFGLYGGTACYGGCYGSCIGCSGHYAGCYGGCYGAPSHSAPIWYGLPYRWHESGNPMVVPPGQGPGGGPAAPGTGPAKPPEAKPAGAAKLIIDLPDGATLYVDDMAMKGKGNSRQFTTPVLEGGRTYYYSVRVEGIRDGKPVNETRRVLVRANEMIRESFVGTQSDSVVKAAKY